MSEINFRIANQEWAKQEFPKRLQEVAAKEHGYAPGETYGLNAEIAEKVGVTRGAVTRWMKGALPRLDTILRVAEAYNTDPAYLVGNNDAPKGMFAVDSIEARIPYETLTKVLRIMSEIRRDARDDLSDEWFAKASIEVLRMVERDPSMPEYAIAGAAYRLLRGGPEALSPNDDGNV